MTVKLLSNWGNQPIGTLYTSDSATETAMIAAGVATATLTGAVPWIPSLGTTDPTHPVQVGLKTASEITAINALIAAGKVNYPEGSWLSLSSTGADNGTRYALKGVGTAATFSASVEGNGNVPFTMSGSFVEGGTAVVTPAAGWAYSGTPKGQWYLTTPGGLPVAVSGATGYSYTFVYGDGGKYASWRPNGVQTEIFGKVVAAAPASTPLANTYYNNSADTLAFRAMMAGILAGVSRTLVVEGDSTTAGVGAGSSGIVGAYANTYASKLAAELTAAGYPAYNDAIFGSQFVSGTSTPYSSYNPKLQLTGAWAVNTALVLGYQPWLVSASGAKATGLWGSRVFNVVDVYYIQFSSNGSVTASVDGGATIQTIDMSGTSGVVRKVTVSVPRGTHTSFDLTTTSASSVYLIGMVPRDTTVGEINIIQCGFSGALAASAATTTNAYSPANAAILSLIAADMLIFQMTINDARTVNNTPDATYKANLNTTTAAWIAAGTKVMLMSGVPSALTATTLAKRNSIKQQVVDVATEKSLVYIDLDARSVSYDALIAKGWAANDELHPNAAFYADEGLWLSQILRNF